jgi:hypothetical protein
VIDEWDFLSYKGMIAVDTGLPLADHFGAYLLGVRVTLLWVVAAFRRISAANDRRKDRFMSDFPCGNRRLEQHPAARAFFHLYKAPPVVCRGRLAKHGLSFGWRSCSDDVFAFGELDGERATGISSAFKNGRPRVLSDKDDRYWLVPTSWETW